VNNVCYINLVCELYDVRDRRVIDATCRFSSSIEPADDRRIGVEVIEAVELRVGYARQEFDHRTLVDAITRNISRGICSHKHAAIVLNK